MGGDGQDTSELLDLGNQLMVGFGESRYIEARRFGLSDKRGRVGRNDRGKENGRSAKEKKSKGVL